MDVDIQRYVQAMPQYQEPLNFLQSILDFQAALAEKIEPGLRIEPAVAREKWRAGHPLFAGESLSVPAPLFQEALADLRPLLPPGEMAQTALDRLLASQLQIGDFGLQIFEFEIVAPHVRADVRNPKYPQGTRSEIRNLEAWTQQLADATSTDPDILALLLRTVLSPFFEKWAMPYQDLVETAVWRRGLCPMCGSEPWLARLVHDSGRRILACVLCRTEWIFDRLRCPFCGGDDQPQLRHFTVDGDEAHRVDCCDRCQRYIKTVDERALGRPANLPVEDVITAHLDVLAREQGYQ